MVECCKNDTCKNYKKKCAECWAMSSIHETHRCYERKDLVEVVRCQNCIHAEPLDHNCELSTNHYLHCRLWRGEETKNVWHKYKKYYKDYSLVERDGYCDSGAKMDGKDGKQ